MVLNSYNALFYNGFLWGVRGFLSMVFLRGNLTRPC